MEIEKSLYHGGAQNSHLPIHNISHHIVDSYV
jgi:hypothetical protein